MSLTLTSSKSSVFQNIFLHNKTHSPRFEFPPVWLKSVFRKAPFFKTFSYTIKRTTRAFNFLRFGGRAFFEKLRFQIHRRSVDEAMISFKQINSVVLSVECQVRFVINSLKILTNLYQSMLPYLSLRNTRGLFRAIQ